MTEELFRSDAYLRECAAVVIAVNENICDVVYKHPSAKD